MPPPPFPTEGTFVLDPYPPGNSRNITGHHFLGLIITNLIRWTFSPALLLLLLLCITIMQYFFLFTKFFLLGRRQGSIHHCCRINLWNLSIGNVYLFFSVRFSCKWFPILLLLSTIKDRSIIKLLYLLVLQWNPVNATTVGP